MLNVLAIAIHFSSPSLLLFPSLSDNQHSVVFGAVDSRGNRGFLFDHDFSCLRVFGNSHVDEFHHSLIIVPQLGIEQHISDDLNFFVIVAISHCTARRFPQVL